MAKDSPSVEECLAMGMTCAFHNLRRASRAVTQVYDAYFDEIGLKATQFVAVLDRLGYIELASGDDRRERIVTLTRTGRAALQRGYPVWKAAQRAVVDALEGAELETQIRSLRRLTKTALALRPARSGRSARPAGAGAREAAR